MNQFNKFLWWMAGADQDCLNKMSLRVRMLYTALGTVFLGNFVFLVFVWGKIGVRYFGSFGFVLGGLIASIFVLGLDRIISMRQRPIRGALEVYRINQPADTRGELILRIAISSVLCLASTFTFQMEQSHGLISAKHAEQARLKNASLRLELVERAEAEYMQHRSMLSVQEEALSEQRTVPLTEQRKAIKIENEAGHKARIAREEEFSEMGGLGARVVGDGVRAKAQRSLANQNEAIEAAARRRKEAAAQALAKIDTDIRETKRQRIEMETNRRKLLDNVDERMVKDIRYVPEKSGLFANATVFIGLFSDPDVSAGMWIFSVIIFGGLLAMELCSLIATKLIPSSQYDVAVIVNEIREAGLIVGSPEISCQTADAMVSTIFTEGLSDKFEGVVNAEEKLRKSKIAKVLNEVRKQQAEGLAPLDIRLTGVPTANDMVKKPRNKPNDNDLEMEVV